MTDASVTVRSGWTWDFMRNLPLQLLVFSAMFAGALALGHLAYLSFADVSAFWPASGIYMAALLLNRTDRWPYFLGVGIATEFVFNLVGQPYPVWACLSFAVGSSLEPLGGTTIAILILRGRFYRNTLRGAFSIAIAAFFGPVFSAVPGVATLLALGHIKDFGQAFQMWWLSDMIGILVFAPAVAIWFSPPYFWNMRLSAYNIPDLVITLAIALGLTFYIFTGKSDGHTMIDRPFALFPILVWAAVRHWPFLIVTLVPVITVIMVVCTNAQLGPFVYFELSNAARAQRVQEFVGLLAITTMFLSAMTYSRRQLQDKIHDMDADFRRVARANDAGQMVSALAHEVSQPLAATTNFAQAARRFLGKGDPDSLKHAGEALDRTVEEAHRANTVVRDLRALLERREMNVARQAVGDLVADTLAFLSSRGVTRSVTVRRAVSENLPEVAADRVHIQQVLTNLVANAVDAATDRSKCEIVVRAAREGDMVRISVEDNGPGVPADFKEKLFEPFASTKPGGMGIGLALCRTIVEAHSGEISVADAAGGGTVVSFTLRAW